MRSSNRLRSLLEAGYEGHHEALSGPPRDRKRMHATALRDGGWQLHRGQINGLAPGAAPRKLAVSAELAGEVSGAFVPAEPFTYLNHQA